MNLNFPIFSLSWGGTRRFLFRPKSERVKPELNFVKMLELYLEDGDLLIMGGRAQEYTKHEIPKWRKTKDPGTVKRVSWTVRAFKDNVKTKYDVGKGGGIKRRKIICF